jgi:small multidrug resistance family-3 protein
MNVMAWGLFLGAAFLEVGGDALIRKGLQSSGIFLIVMGFLVLGGYGLVVNMVRWDFSKLLGTYVAIFASVSVLFGALVFREIIAPSTWAGLALIVMGGLLIQSGVR